MSDPMRYFLPVLMFVCGWLLGYYLGRAHGGRDTTQMMLGRLQELRRAAEEQRA